MNRETYSEDGPFNVDDPEFVDALTRAERAVEAATREREEHRREPGFFVVPTDLLPTL